MIHDLDAWYDMKRRGIQQPGQGFQPIHMPRNTGAGVILSALAGVIGFAMIWYIWWLAAFAFAGLLAVAIGQTFNYHRYYFIPADDVAAIENARPLVAEA